MPTNKVHPPLKEIERKRSTDKIIGLPSSALMPARFIDSQTVVKSAEKRKSSVKAEHKEDMNVKERSSNTTRNEKTSNSVKEQNKTNQQTLRDGDETTRSANDSDENATSTFDSDETLESDSTIPEENSKPRKRRRICIYRIKEELVDTDDEIELITNPNVDNTLPSHIATRHASLNEDNGIIHEKGSNAKTDHGAVILSNKSNTTDINKYCNSPCNDNAHGNAKSGTEISSFTEKTENNLSPRNKTKDKSISLAVNTKTSQNNNRHVSISATDGRRLKNIRTLMNKRCAKNAINIKRANRIGKKFAYRLPLATNDMKTKKYKSALNNEHDYVGPHVQTNSTFSELPIEEPETIIQPSSEVANDTASEVQNTNVKSRIFSNKDGAVFNSCTMPVRKAVQKVKCNVENNQTSSINDTSDIESTNEESKPTENRTLRENSLIKEKKPVPENATLHIKSAVEIEEIAKGNSTEQTVTTATCNQTVSKYSASKLGSTDECDIILSENSSPIGSTDIIAETSVLSIKSISSEDNRMSENASCTGSSTKSHDQFISEYASQIPSVEKSGKSEFSTNTLKNRSTLKEGNLAESEKSEIKQTQQTDALLQYKSAQSTFQENVRMPLSHATQSSRGSNSSDSSTGLISDSMKNKSEKMLKYLNLNAEINKNDIYDCLNYMTTKYPQDTQLNMFLFDTEDIIDTQEKKSEKSNHQVAEDETIIMQFTKENTPPVPPKSNTPEKADSENANHSPVPLISIEEMKKIMATGVSVPVVCSSASKDISPKKIYFMHSSLDKDTSSDLQTLLMEVQERTGNQGAPNTFEFASKSIGLDCCTIPVKSKSPSSNLSSNEKHMPVPAQVITAEENSVNICETTIPEYTTSQSRDEVCFISTGKMKEVVNSPIIPEVLKLDSSDKPVSCEIGYPEKPIVDTNITKTITKATDAEIIATSVPTLEISEGCCPSDDMNRLMIPSNEELKKIIMNVSLLPNITSENSSNLSGKNTAKNKRKSPEIEIILQDDNPSSLVSPTTNLESNTANEVMVGEIELLKVKKRNLQQNNAPNQSSINIAVVRGTAKSNIVSNTFQQNSNNTPNQPAFNKGIAQDSSKKNIDCFQGSKMDDSSNISKAIIKDTAQKTKKSTGSKIYKTDKTLDKLPQKIPSTSGGQRKDTKSKIKTTPVKSRPIKTMESRGNNSKEKNASITNEKRAKRIEVERLNFSPSNATDSPRIIENSVLDENENMRKIRLIYEESCRILENPNILQGDISRETSIALSHIINSKSALARPPVSSSVAANTQIVSKACSSDKDAHNRSEISVNPVYSEVTSSVDPPVTNQGTGPENNSKSVDRSPNKYEEKSAKVFFHRRKGNPASLAKCLHKNVGKHFIGINELPSLILEWNADWLLTQRETKKCAPICDAYESVRDIYRNELEYYNTYFPLHLLSIWLKISDSWKKSSPSFDSVIENQVEKPNFVKVTCSTILSLTNFANWPKREDILLCIVSKPDGSVERLFGRVCNVMSKDYNPPANSCLQSRAGILKKVKLEFFCAEALLVPFLTKVQMQVLCNIRIPLMQNDALQHLNNAMKEFILDPRKHGSHFSFIPLQPHRDPTFHRCVKSIVDSVMSPRTSITIVDTSSPCDVLLAIAQLTIALKKQHCPVLIGLRNEDSFLKLAHNLKHYNLILAVKKKEVAIPEELKRFTLEERLTVVPGRQMFTKWHITLTLLSSIFLGDFTDAFAEQNLICILHDAHLCTETETALLLYYDVKHLILMGNREAQTDMHPILKRFGYNISLFDRFCKAK